MIERSAARRIALVCLAGGTLLVGAGCRGPLAPTPGFGEEVRANRVAMVENPDATAQNVEPVDGIRASTAQGVLKNYHRNEEVDSQERRQKTTKGKDLQF